MNRHQQRQIMESEGAKSVRLFQENRNILEMLGRGLRRENSRVRLWKLIKRDGRICWLCRQPMDPDLMGSAHQMAPTIDHVIPKSRGGSDKLKNLRAAHRECNQKRGNAMPTSESSDA